MVHTFGELNDGDVVKVSLSGLFKVSHGEAWVGLESVDGYENWFFDLKEGEGWEIIKVSKEI